MSDIVERYSKLNNSVINLGLERVTHVLNDLHYVDGKLKVVHISGSNGKGSVAEYVTQILIAAGKRVGTYTSPEVYDFCEQFRLDGKNIQRDALDKLLERVSAVGAKYKATPFEIQTAAALVYFLESNAEYAVIECGMGGTLDATNVIEKKVLALISSVSLEHTAYLGNTIEEICAHKAGIIKNCPAVVGNLQEDGARAYFKKLNLQFSDKPLKIINSDLNGTTFLYGGEEYSIQMLGDAQPYNAALAIEGAKLLGIDQKYIKEGLTRTKLLGRAEVIKKRGNVYILDGCHNPASCQKLYNLIKNNFKKVDYLLFGCLGDKDIDGCLTALSPLVTKVFAVKCNSIRAMEKDKIMDACNRHFSCAEWAESLPLALERAEGSVLVCGSFTLLAEAKEWIEKE